MDLIMTKVLAQCGAAQEELAMEQNTLQLSGIAIIP